MSDYTIRQATFADAETLAHIGVATFIESYTTEIDGAAMIAHCSREHSKAAYEAYLAKSTGQCWLAEHGKTGAPIGYALSCPPDLPVTILQNDIELKRIYVLSKFHGQGIANALLEKAIAHARSIPAPRLLLGTYEENHRALAFYHKHGFKTVGVRKFNVGDQIYDDIVMAKAL